MFYYKYLVQGFHLRCSTYILYRQVTHLFERWLLRQSADNLQEFKQLLVDTDYHTNVILSHMLPEQAQEKGML